MNIDDKINEIQVKAAREIECVRAKAERDTERARLRQTINAEWKEKCDALKKRLEVENRLAGHSKKDLLWNLAYEMGTGGLLDVEYYYDTMAELLEP